MTGPEHYREAERLLADAATPVVIRVEGNITQEQAGEIRQRFEAETGTRPLVYGGGTHVDCSPILLAAQVHATLALAAATASSQANAYDGDEDGSRSRGWAGVA